MNTRFNHVIDDTSFIRQNMLRQSTLCFSFLRTGLKTLFVELIILSLLISGCGKPPESGGSTKMGQLDSASEDVEVQVDVDVAAVEAPAELSYSEAPSETAALVEPSKVESSKSIRLNPDKKIGNILYNPPTEMTLNETQRVEVRIGHEPLTTTGLVGTGVIIDDEIPVSEYMTVRLCCGEPEEDHPFDIVALNQERQIVDNTGFTQWAFDVTAKKGGSHYINLSVSAHYTFANGEVRTKDSPVKSDRILINVNKAKETKNWFINNWQWLGLFLLVPLLVFYVIRNIKGRKRASSHSGNESVFISYRRDDSSGYTLAIYEQLKNTFGDEQVFMDMDDIPHGEDFVTHIEKCLSKANTMLVMIGQNWLNAENAKGRRLDNPEDFVRLEVATALQRDIVVIPVLLKNTQMPSEEDLPKVLQALSRKNGIRIHDDQFDASVQILIQAIGENT